MQTMNIEYEVQQFIVENFMFGQSGDLKHDESLLERGVINSTGVLELVTFLQDRFSITVEDNDVVPENLDTVDRIVAYVTNKVSTTL